MERKVGILNLIAYGVGDFFGGGSYLIIGTLYIFFLTEVVGMKPFLAGLVVFAGKFWDAISDPLMGYFSDRTMTRFGRRRIYFLIGIIPVFVSFMLLWHPAGFIAENMRFAWHMFTYIFLCTTLTLVTVPYVALLADMSEDYKVRNRLAGSRMLLGSVAILLCGVAPKMIVNSRPEAGQGYLAMGIIFGLFFALPWLFTFIGTWELPQKRVAKAENFKSIYLNFFSVFRNKSFRIQACMYVFVYSAMDILMALFLYYLTYFILKPEHFSLLMGALMLFFIISVPLYVKICNLVGQGRAYLVGMGIGAGSLILLFYTFSPAAPLYLLILGISLIGIGLSGATVAVQGMLPAVIDVDELITTSFRGGTYAGMLTLIRKAVQALILFLVSLSLTLIGYNPDLAPSAGTVASLRYLFVAAPLLMAILGVIIASRYKITPEVHRLLLGETKRLKAGGTKDGVEPQTAALCEALSGIGYANLYCPSHQVSGSRSSKGVEGVDGGS